MNAIASSATLLLEARTRAGLSQRELARLAGTAQSVVARIETGLANPGADTLERLLSAAGFRIGMELVPQSVTDPLIEAFKKDIDRTLLRRNLEKTPEERVSSLQALADFAREARRAGRAARATA